MTDESSKLLESRLVAELAAINRKIDELALERRGLERLIIRVRREEVSNREVGRKNSARRILVERAVLQKLADAKGKSVSLRDLFNAANDIELNLNESTFRSHLYRLKARGLIAQGKLAGRYRLPDTKPGLGPSDE